MDGPRTFDDLKPWQDRSSNKLCVKSSLVPASGVRVLLIGFGMGENHDEAQTIFSQYPTLAPRLAVRARPTSPDGPQ